MRYMCQTFTAAVLALALFAVPNVLAATQSSAIREAILQNNPAMDENQNRRMIESMIAQLFRSGGFEDLEYVARQFRKRKLKTASGLNKLASFHFSLYEFFSLNICRGPFGEKIESLIQEWLQQYPKSTSAHLAYAQMLMARAWAVRGDGYAGTVKPESWAPFFEYLKKARQYLQDNEQFRNGDPRWDLVLLEIARAQNMPREEYQKLSRAALDRNPGFYQLYFSIVDNSLPKWGGSADEVEKFANEAVMRTRGKDGRALYARVYWHVANNQYGEDMFTQSSVRWDEMKRGMDDVLKKYPDTWNTYHFAMFACFAKDQKKTQQLMTKLKNERITDDWPYFESYERCKTFAAVK
jgi:AraC-like DNA-binding protein